MDEREKPYPVTKFKTVSACMMFIAEELMHEELYPGPRSPGNNMPLIPSIATEDKK